MQFPLLLCRVTRHGAYSIGVRYKEKEERHLMNSGDTGFGPSSSDLKCLLTCNGKLIGIYSETEIRLQSVVTDETYVTYYEFGTDLATRKCLTDNPSSHLVTCIGKHMVANQIKYNTVATIEWLKREVQKQNTASNMNRIQQQLDEELKNLEALEKKDAQEKSKFHYSDYIYANFNVNA
ncbi:uncharacterized protein LOC142338183 [Convolutriloba macropyga]|uniref:uncharacterized protein LOC142338183 n=1 Tax=Convolutriloba macropyga TaxID=536237 RepID=UPI003F51B570